ncbi:hypothetical protein LJC47_08025 [Desulfosarcina sp. OttesenSCG-928-B08]|nr:hypothetical protein [Desulfosarcina sp. OttesenSCG-928-B08]
MKTLRFILVVTLFAVVFPNCEAAAKGKIPIPVPYSNEERLHRIADLQVKFGENEVYDLGYKTRGRYLFSVVGIWIDNEGYVLIPEGDDTRYISVSDQQLQNFVQHGLLPADLPDKPRMSTEVMAKGFMLWPVLFLIVLPVTIFYIKTKQRQKNGQ